MDYIKRQKDARWKNNSLLCKIKVPMLYDIHFIVKNTLRVMVEFITHFIQTINLDLSLPIIYIQSNSL